MNLSSLYNFWKKLSKKEKIFFCVASFVGIAALVDIGIIQPITYRRDSLSQEIKKKEAAIQQALHILGQRERILEEKEIYGDYFASQKSEDEEILSILKEIGSLAEETQVYLQEVRPGRLEEGPPFDTYRVTISFEGQMGQVASFIYKLEDSEKLMRVESLNLSPKSPGSSVAVCRMTISRIVVK